MKTLMIIVSMLILAIPAGYARVPDKYLKMAVENNPGLQARYREFEAAMQRIPQAGSLPDPTLMAGFRAWPSGTMPGMEKATISLTQMFPWFGTLKAKGDEAALKAEALYEVYIDQRNDLFYQLAEIWYPLYELHRFSEIEQENITILSSYKNIAMRNFENGTGPMVDVLRTDIMITEAQTRLSVLDDRETALTAAFNNLMNRNADDPVDIPDSININLTVPEFNYDTMLQHNPRLRELDLRHRASEYTREAVRKEGLPNVGIGLEYMYMGNEPEMSNAGMKKGALMPMITLSLPIYRDKYKAAEEEVRLMQESYALQKENTMNVLSSGYSSALSEINQQQKLIEQFNRQIKTTGQSLNLLFQSYSNSGNEFEEVLRMQQQLLQFEKEKVSAQAAMLVAHARLNYLTGNTPINDENR